MAGRLTFRVGDLRPLYEHSLHAKEQGATFADLYEPKFHRGSAIKKRDDGLPDAANIDRSLIPASLLLVGDDAIYFMSNGLPSLPAPDGGPNRVVYAQECDPRQDPDGWYDAKRRIWGGDDSGERLELSMFRRLMEWPDDAIFTVSVSTKRIAINLPKAR